MTAVNFPNSPALNDEFVVENIIYKWNGSVWEVKQSTLSSSSFSNSNPVMNGSAAAGTSGLASRSDHVHPSDTSKASATHASSHGSAGSDPITIAQSQVTNLTTDLSNKANLASPTFTGVPAAPTAAAATNTTQIATTQFVRTEISNLVASAPASLDTLNELATALGNDANFSTTVTNSIADKVSRSGGDTITVSSGSTVPLTIQNNGTGNSFVVNDVTSDTTPFVIDASGNVGIGLNSASSKFHIRSSGEIYRIETSDNVSSGGTCYFTYYDSSLNRKAYLGFGGTNDTFQINVDANGPLTMSTNNVERMRIGASGRIQIPAGGILEAPVSTNVQTASYTLVLTDAGRLIEMNVGSANNLTVPLDSSVNFPVGTKIDILQTGAGQTAVVATGGVTINASPGLKLSGQWSAASLIKRASNTWVLIGNLTA